MMLISANKKINYRPLIDFNFDKLENLQTKLKNHFSFREKITIV
jgi:hypothetical protein